MVNWCKGILTIGQKNGKIQEVLQENSRTSDNIYKGRIKGSSRLYGSYV